jgi:hypothetical protein
VIIRFSTSTKKKKKLSHVTLSFLLCTETASVTQNLNLSLFVFFLSITFTLLKLNIICCSSEQDFPPDISLSRTWHLNCNTTAYSIQALQIRVYHVDHLEPVLPASKWLAWITS